MNNPWDEVEEWARSKKAEHEAAQQQASNDERFNDLGAKIDTLADGFKQFVESSSKRTPDANEEDGGAAPIGEVERTPTKPESVPPPPPEPELPVEVVTRGSIPRIYTGDDEPETVEYIDGPSGETRTRPGRKKGHPTTWIVEQYEPAPGEETAA